MHGKEPPLISQGRSHGSRILALTAGAPGSNEGLLQLADVRRGDVLEMKAAHFRTVEEAPVERVEWGKWQKGGGQYLQSCGRELVAPSGCKLGLRVHRLLVRRGF